MLSQDLIVTDARGKRMAIEIWRHAGRGGGYWSKVFNPGLKVSAGDHRGTKSGFTISATMPVPHGTTKFYLEVSEEAYPQIVAAMMERSPYKAERSFLEAMLKRKRAVKKAER